MAALSNKLGGIANIGKSTVKPLMPKPGKANAGLPDAMPPAGLPPAEYASPNLPGKPKAPKPGPLVANAARRITPALPNPGRMDKLLESTQTSSQLSPDAVMGMDNQRWQQLLSKFGVFS